MHEPVPAVADPPVNLMGRTVPYKHIVAVAFVIGLFMDILDMTIVGVLAAFFINDEDAAPTMVKRAAKKAVATKS